MYNSYTCHSYTRVIGYPYMKTASGKKKITRAPVQRVHYCGAQGQNSLQRTCYAVAVAMNKFISKIILKKLRDSSYTTIKKNNNCNYNYIRMIHTTTFVVIIIILRPCDAPKWYTTCTVTNNIPSTDYLMI